MRRFTWPPAGKWPPDGLGSDGVDLKTLMAKRPTTPAGASESEASADGVGEQTGASLADSIKFECKRKGIPFTAVAIADAFAKAETQNAPSLDAIKRHIGGETKLSPNRKGLNGETLAAYAELFGLDDPDSLQRPTHIRDRMRELSKPTTKLAIHTMAARDADLESARKRLESLWGGPHQSLAFFLLDYLAEG